MQMNLLPLFLLLTTLAIPVHSWIQYPSDGTATMTHYTIPKDYIAACGCTGASTHYPTAAMSQMAFGSSAAYGPGCGRCFKLTLLNTYTPTPPFFPDVTKSVVVKVTDLCPIGGAGWCSATADKPNKSGQYINFDLAWPSPAIPDDFFPSNASLYGYTDFGVWNVTYQTVDCLSEWAGAKQAAALGSVADGSSVCCPANPSGSANDTCPSYSDQNGIPPDTTTSGASLVNTQLIPPLYYLFVLVVYFSIPELL
ncbi:RlpA-like double-psi beta-barrel-protein domain-containing protein-containing protein [Cristinia sonorae]|uniref:RlpA-like double-psi beta-barrel-protein domain-containing protein-containing protein n=1 Tax=Cristinia sonorae TaxID=1940300 RepID=A0A8K0UYX1_9AGAR|nr:RlpA-like double-psi beta-barrel-protein domain-containing protein-containing protein [Cristinia sonorae]